jgi:four helix bundle protein
MSRDYRTLIAWQKADDLAVEMYRATQNFPREEIYGLRAQIRRAAVSVAANLAEGSGKRTARDRRASFDDAMGELNELEYYIHLSFRLGYIDKATATQLEELRAEAARTLDGLLKKLDRTIQGQRP